MPSVLLRQKSVYDDKGDDNGEGICRHCAATLRAEYSPVIIELKCNRTPESAIDQIREKDYFAALEKYRGNLLFAGVSYDADTKQHSYRITRFVKA